MTTNKKPNRLANEKSPYLLQHAFNPVDWFPWSEEAFEKANQENKPIFLSIGYSTCHWCHVMERESFEDEEAAEVLNRDYISIKVDREERPDVDHLYMGVCQALTGQGGWPLTILMTPDKEAFFAGTYFPKRRRHGRIGLIELLEQVAAKWKDDRGEVVDSARKIMESTARRTLSTKAGEVSLELLDQAYSEYGQTFDETYGGFGEAPKFPTPHHLMFLLRYYHRTGKEHALLMVEKTLDGMHRGGLYDHVGFGFTRYSTDEQWLVPHFEKMLYDNALLAMAYTEAYQVTGKPKYSGIAEQIFTYVLRDMTDQEGGFYSAEDADSEGEEGKFYVWSEDEVLKVLGPELGELFCEVYDITAEGNFEGHHSIPNLLQASLSRLAATRSVTEEALTAQLEQAREQLFQHREQRVHPGKDDKVLTSWNALMIAALAKGARAFDKPEYAYAAERAAHFVLTRLRREDGRLLARWRDGEAAFPGYIDDYAFMVWALIELYETTFDISWMKIALELNEDMIRLFWDEKDGGFYFYGSDGEQLPSRMKEIYDGAIPSGNSVAAYNIIRLAKYTDRAPLKELADRQLAAFGGTVQTYPPGHSMFMIAMDFALSPGSEIVIAGQEGDEERAKMKRVVRERFLPNAIVVQTREEPQPEWGDLFPFTAGKHALEGNATAYVCSGYACQAPVGTSGDLIKQL
ncbi:thioredoxin domain-containing protein [Paenibacillus turpanensis]|uniref:thioredoxin domain-containing protein n=1 Tax=Paenibacillus turpanensis TaxID=2689078 RepID=UPI00140A5652|nr:thioredoxin domain-containing protein [Paenibacillus turpanensis]